MNSVSLRINHPTREPLPDEPLIQGKTITIGHESSNTICLADMPSRKIEFRLDNDQDLVVTNQDSSESVLLNETTLLHGVPRRLDATGKLESGDYSFHLILPERSSLNEVKISVARSTTKLTPGQTHTLQVIVENSSKSNGYFYVTVQPEFRAWITKPSGTAELLGYTSDSAVHKHTFNLEITAPVNPPAQAKTYTVRLDVESENTTHAVASTQCEWMVLPLPNVTSNMEEVEDTGCRHGEYLLEIGNVGNVPITYHLGAKDVQNKPARFVFIPDFDKAWGQFDGTAKEITINVGQTAKVKFQWTVPRLWKFKPQSRTFVVQAKPTKLPSTNQPSTDEAQLPPELDKRISFKQRVWCHWLGLLLLLALFILFPMALWLYMYPKIDLFEIKNLAKERSKKIQINDPVEIRYSVLNASQTKLFIDEEQKVVAKANFSYPYSWNKSGKVNVKLLVCGKLPWSCFKEALEVTIEPKCPTAKLTLQPSSDIQNGKDFKLCWEIEGEGDITTRGWDKPLTNSDCIMQKADSTKTYSISVKSPSCPDAYDSKTINVSPIPTPCPTPKPWYNFLDTYKNALWVNDEKLLTTDMKELPRNSPARVPITDGDCRKGIIGGSTDSPLGVIRKCDQTELLSGNKYLALQTRPDLRKNNGGGGIIAGRFILQNTIVNGDIFKTKLGFFKLDPKGNVEVSLYLNKKKLDTIQMSGSATALKDWEVKLPSCSGNCVIDLVVKDIAGGVDGKICWIEPRIEGPENRKGCP